MNAPRGAYARPWTRAQEAPIVHTYVTLSTQCNNYLKTDDDDPTIYLFREGDQKALDTLLDACKRRRCAIWRDSAMLGRGAVALIGET